MGYWTCSTERGEYSWGGNLVKREREKKNIRTEKKYENDYVIIKVAMGMLEKGMHGWSKENEPHQSAIWECL